MGNHEAHGSQSLNAGALPVPIPDDPSPPSMGAESMEAGRVLFVAPCAFIMAAASLTQLPDADLPEIAFAGRSNVGKSSLVNALTGRSTLARTSNTPGRTQQVIFFRLGDRLMLVDLPGYGYAEAPKAVVRQWTGLVYDYLRGRPPLRRTLLLIDARHGLKDNDRQVMAMLDSAAVNYQLVLTKADKLKPGQVETRRTAILAELARHTAAYPEVLVTSSNSGQGIPELRAALAEIAHPKA
ncbi:MAG: YihA family ribosome biogenesis GTP-binding protein [Alphaproteobacteria bacterium]|nr:YihA family ribosome biogenesis GTP-binding protein [Alphaproteobacteria bacterium]